MENCTQTDSFKNSPDAGSTFSGSDGDPSVSDEEIKVINPSKYGFVARKKQYVMYLKEQKVPRVVKGDIRKCYPAMLANVLNSGDFPLIYGFLDTFLSPNIRHSSAKTVTTVTNETIQMDDYHVGVFGMAKYWCSILNIGPDVVFHIRKPQIHSFSKSECSRVVCEFEMHGTRVFDMSQSGLQTASRAVEEYERKRTRREGASIRAGLSDAEELVASPRDVVGVALEMQRLVREYLSSLGLAADPIKFKSVGTLVMFTDESKRIARVDLDTTMDQRAVVQ